MVRADRRETPGPDRRNAEPFELDAPTRLGMIGVGGELPLRRCAPAARARPVPPQAASGRGRNAVRSRRRGRAGRDRKRQGRSRRALVRAACAAASRRSRATTRSGATGRAPGAERAVELTRCRCACPGGAPSRRTTRRADRLVPDTHPQSSPAVSVDVMSLAEWTATSMRPASNASSISLTNTPRSPISPNGRVRSRSPAVVIGTNAISMPSRRSTAPACSACVSASLEPREPMRTSTGHSPSASRPAAERAPGPDTQEGRWGDDRQRTLDPAFRVAAQLRSSSRPKRWRTASA